jgi:hypothetical protein
MASQALRKRSCLEFGAVSKPRHQERMGFIIYHMRYDIRHRSGIFQ